MVRNSGKLGVVVDKARVEPVVLSVTRAAALVEKLKMEAALEKRLKSLFKKLKEQGWEINPSKKGWMVVPPDKSKPMVTIHGTPSDNRSWKNMIAQLKRSGFIWR